LRDLQGTIVHGHLYRKGNEGHGNEKIDQKFFGTDTMRRFQAFVCQMDEEIRQKRSDCDGGARLP
jgi:hypothetical protein